MQPKLTTTQWTEDSPQRNLVRGARLGPLALAWVSWALLAVAGTTQRPRHRALPVQSAEGPSPGRPKADGKNRNRAAKTSPEHAQSGRAPKRSAPRATPHAKQRRRDRAEEDNPGPVTMKRTGHPAVRSCRAHCSIPVVAPRRTAMADTRRTARAAAKEAADRAAALRSAELAASIEARVRAQARRAPPTARAESTLQPPAPVVRVPAGTRRVDGFGAEGAELDTPATHAALVPGATAVPAVPEDPALEALAHPSRNALAEEAMEPQVLPRLYSAAGRLMVPAPLTGSHDVLVHQNTMADDEGLSRIRNDAELNRLRAQRLLVEFPVSESLRVNPELAANRRCARPWTVRFAAETARAFYARFHQPLVVTSAARTVNYQLRLQRTNGNAAAVEGDTASPHLTGQAIDFGKRGMSTEQLAWMRAFLLPLMTAGKIDVEEEFQQACFHISVYRSYVPVPPRKRMPPKTEIAKNREQGLGTRD